MADYYKKPSDTAIKMFEHLAVQTSIRYRYGTFIPMGKLSLKFDADTDHGIIKSELK